MKQRHGWFRALALGLAAVMLFAACSGDDGEGGDEGQSSERVPVSEYVDDLCNSLINWRDSVQQTEAEFQQENALTENVPPEEAKAKLGAYLGDLEALTDDFVSDLQEAGIPDVERGEEVAGQFVSGFQQFSQALEDLQGQVEELPTGSAAEFREAGTQFLTEIQTSLQGSLQSLDEIDSQPIDQAFRESEACAQVQPAG